MTTGSGPGLLARSIAPASAQIRVMEVARHAAIVGIAGVITGVLVGGVGGRVLMRIAAVAAPDRVIGATTENGNRIGDITVGGTLAIVVFVGVLLGLVGAIAYLVAEPWLAWTGRWRGVAFGVFLLAIGGAGTLTSDNFDFFLVGNQELVVAMFVALFLGFGMLLVPVVARLEQRLPPINQERPLAGGWGYLALAGFGLQFVLLFFVQFFVDDAASGEAPVLTGIMVVGLTAATALHLTRPNGRDRVIRALQFSGYGFLAAAFLVGGTRVVDDIRTILSL